MNRKLTCEVCGNNFICQVNDQTCWCMNLDKKYIAANLKDCICREYLSKTPILSLEKTK